MNEYNYENDINLKKQYENDIKIIKNIKKILLGVSSVSLPCLIASIISREDNFIIASLVVNMLNINAFTDVKLFEAIRKEMISRIDHNLSYIDFDKDDIKLEKDKDRVNDNNFGYKFDQDNISVNE